MIPNGLQLGPTYLEHGKCRFRVWAPELEVVDVCIVHPQPRVVPMQRDARGYFEALVDEIEPGARYFYRLDGTSERPDPASRYQPQGVHGPSQVVTTAWDWQDSSWKGIPWDDYVIYEIHVGAFTPEGTFEAAIRRLDDLKQLGVTAIELMPVSQFPGDRNWGYDGVHPFAAQDSYGGPEGLMRLVDACHRRGIAVLLDVVYNHLGPEGNYLREFAPYFTSKYHTPWGDAINFDGPHSDEVRFFFIQSALYWIVQLHIDGLRVDAVHAIFDQSARPFLQELADAVHQAGHGLGRHVHVTAESNLNDTRHVRPAEQGGFGMDAQWNDDFHHALHTLLTREKDGYYVDFGRLEDLGKAVSEGFVYTGQYSQYRQRRHGVSARQCRPEQFVVFSQNHDQTGNRMLGERLSELVGAEELKLAAGVVLLSASVPLLFMGEEYGERAPFQYFISHLDAGLVEAVRRGRREEFAAFRWLGEPPDPFDAETFRRCVLGHDKWSEGCRSVLRKYYRELIRQRRSLKRSGTLCGNTDVTVRSEEQVLLVRPARAENDALIAYHFGDALRTLGDIPVGRGSWKKALDSSDSQWSGPGSRISDEAGVAESLRLTVNPKSCVLMTCMRTT